MGGSYHYINDTECAVLGNLSKVNSIRLLRSEMPSISELILQCLFEAYLIFT